MFLFDPTTWIFLVATEPVVIAVLVIGVIWLVMK